MAFVIKRDKPIVFRVLVLILAILVLATAPLSVFGEAHAIVVIDDLAVGGVVVIIAAILVAGGMIVDNQDNIIAVAKKVYDDAIAGSAILFDELKKLAKGVASLQDLKKTAAIHVSQRLWDAIFGSFKETVVSDGANLTIPIDATGRVLQQTDAFDWREPGLQPYFSDAEGTNYTFTHGAVTYSHFEHPYYYYNCTLSYSKKFADGSGSGRKKVCEFRTGENMTLDAFIARYCNFNFQLYNRTDWGEVSYGFAPFGITINTMVKPVYPITLGILRNISATGSIVVPAPDTLVKVPSLPKLGEDGKVMIPPIPLNPDDLRVKDLPDVVLPGAGVVDLPYDAVIDMSTGKTIEGDIPDVPSEGSILDQIKALPGILIGSPSDFVLSFDGFKNTILIDRFPFSIPFDLVNSVKAFQSNSDFKISLDLKTQYFEIHHPIDLEPFRVPVLFFRSFLLFAFVVFLIIKTRSLIKW